MIVVVTGSTGFIGSHLVNQMLASGITVRALVRPESNRQLRNKHVEYHEVDLQNAEAVAASPAWSGAERLFHLAGVTKANNIAQFRRGNVEPLTNILAALAARPDPPRIVVVSSQAAAGPAQSRERPVTESDPARPFEPYGISKREAELVAESYADRLAITIVRPPAVYGPRDKDFREAFKQASSPYALHAVNPEYWFDLVHVNDVLHALALAAREPIAIGRTYFLSGDAPTTWREFYNEVARVAGSMHRQIKVPDTLLRIAALAGDVVGSVTNRTPLLNSQKLSLAKPEFWLCSSQRIRDELGWRPQVTQRAAMRDTYLSYQRR